MFNKLILKANKEMGQTFKISCICYSTHDTAISFLFEEVKVKSLEHYNISVRKVNDNSPELCIYIKMIICKSR